MATTAKTTSSRKTAAKATAKPAASRRSGTPARAKDGTFKSNGNHWQTAAIVGGVAAVGAVATAALFALRGSTVLSDMEDMLLNKGDSAHQADGRDSSASFDARVADEGTIPA